MERLTRSDGGEEQLLYACDNCIRGLGEDNPPCATCDYEIAALEKLAAYEDTGLTPERCAGLARAATIKAQCGSVPAFILKERARELDEKWTRLCAEIRTW